MALTMLDKKAVQADHKAWAPELKAEFERESREINGCVGTTLLSETDPHVDLAALLVGPRDPGRGGPGPYRPDSLALATGDQF